MDTLLPLVLQLTGVTLYPQGGLYTYTGLFSAQKGFTQAVWAELPPGTDPTTLRVSLPSSAKGYIVQTAIEPLSPTWRKVPPDLQLLQQRIDSLDGLLARWNTRLTLLAAQESTLLENKHLGGEDSPTHPEEVEKYLLLLERQLTRVLEEKVPLQKRIAAAQDTLRRWKEQYQNRMQGLKQARAALFITYWAPQKEAFPIRVELSGPPASWRLYYRIRALPAMGKVLLQRWAEVENRSGEDWKNMPLTLSTARPGQSGEMSPFLPWYVDMAAPIATKGRYSLLAAEAAPPAGDASGEQAGEELEGPAAPPPLPVIAEQTLSRTYDLGPQTVIAGQRATQFFLREDTIEATFQFFVNAPAEERAYLRAALPAGSFFLWEKAPATVEVEGQEVSRITWPPQQQEDTLWLDLGPSSRIQVRRIETLNRRETRLTGGTIHHQFAYKLSLSHTYTAPIRLTVWDRIPVSRTSEIKIELNDAAGATLDPEKGQLRWDITLPPGESWERTFRFTVKYPKQKPIIGL
ncbi:MAG: DUF4139 domain-containing protein [Bacteroidia bacterium]|nr:DUF4139 domain-containing protein [Bacteroidia bacterium]GIV22527.1 MAG: hypothetical protein KatS3mg025_0186 [Bacteroidia bacterium]